MKKIGFMKYMIAEMKAFRAKTGKRCHDDGHMYMIFLTYACMSPAMIERRMGQI